MAEVDARTLGEFLFFDPDTSPLLPAFLLLPGATSFPPADEATTGLVGEGYLNTDSTPAVEDVVGLVHTGAVSGGDPCSEFLGE